jgi:predicted ribosomally synthesized peptide with SipW-like signal peptide
VRAAGAVAAATVVGVGSLGTYAFWTDAATVASGTLTSGTLDLEVDGSQGTPSYDWAALTLTDMAPGESVAAQLSVQNTGTTPFTFSATGTYGAGIQPYFHLRVVRGGTAGNSGAAYPRTGTCTGGTETFATAQLADGATVVPTSPVVAPGGSTTVCVVASLPLAAANAAQGATGTLTLQVSAVQQQ